MFCPAVRVHVQRTGSSKLYVGARVKVTEPATAVVLPAVVVPAPAGHATLTLQVPANPQLEGVPILSQALFAPASGTARLGNLVSGVIER